MEASFLQCSATAPSHRPLLLHPSTATTFSSSSCSFKPKFPPSKHVMMKISTRISPRAAAVPARDRVIDFGRHKGMMLGTLPSAYLKWVSTNLRARDYEGWARLADDVLSDPVYRDRIEWEFADKLLNGDVTTNSSRSDDSVSQLLEISERFGWDNDDKVGWSKVDFGLLGTSKGGRIPRVSEDGGGVERELRLKREKVKVSGGGEEMGGERRRERRERLRLQRGGGGVRSGYGSGKSGNVGLEGDGDDQAMLGRNEDRTVENRSPFPGRESLLKKVLNGRRP